MSEAKPEVWPDGLPLSYFNPELLERDRPIDYPFMNIDFGDFFLLAYMAGLLLIAIFAWSRFKHHTFDPDAIDYRVLQQLQPTDLRSKDLMERAYLLYAVVLLAAYTLLTFFGGLFVQLFGSISIGGLQVSTENENFQRPEWPLVVSLGIIGLLPMLKPVQIVEEWLRRYAHRSVGIPTMIRSNAAKLVRRLDPFLSEALEKDDKWQPYEERVPSWLVEHVDDKDAIIRVFKIREQVQRLSNWIAHERGHWPHSEVRAKLSQFERSELSDARIAIQDFDELIEQNYAKPPAAPKDAPKDREAVQVRLVLHQRRLERHWTLLRERLERLREELSAILAFYVEHDSDYHEMNDNSLKEFLEKTFPKEEIHNGPGVWVLASAIVLVPFFMIAIYSGFQSYGGQVEENIQNVIISSLFDTAKVLALSWLPLSLVANYRYFRREQDQWTLINIRQLSPAMIRQMAICATIAYLAAFIGYALVSMLQSALLASDQSKFQHVFLTGPLAFVKIAATLAPIASVNAVMSVLAMDKWRATNGMVKIRQLLPLGLVSAALATLYYQFFIFAWFPSGASCVWPPFEGFMTQGGFKTCVNLFSLFSGALLVLLAFLSSTWFIPRPLVDPADGDKPVQNSSTPIMPALHGTPASILAWLVVPIAIFAGFASPALGHDFKNEGKAIKHVHVGFRSDAEPFSYRIEQAGEERFSGFLVELCQRIFAGDKYVMFSHEVTVGERFTRLRNKESESHLGGKAAGLKQPIDLVCDPITIRFDNENPLRSRGIFSPIVFVSGVSYIQRNHTRRRGDVHIGFLDNTTAEAPARRACEIDLFKVREAKNDCSPDELDVLSWPLAKAIALRAQNWFAGGNVDAKRTSRYVYHKFSSHKDIISWFCEDGEEDYHKVYFGDFDIIIGKLEARLAKGGACKDVDRRSQSYTYEPYALLITPDNPELIQYVQRRVYEIFSDRHAMVGLFVTHFPGKKMSEPLASLFLLNAVEDGKKLRGNTEQKNDDAKPVKDEEESDPLISNKEGSPDNSNDPVVPVVAK